MLSIAGPDGECAHRDGKDDKEHVYGWTSEKPKPDNREQA